MKKHGIAFIFIVIGAITSVLCMVKGQMVFFEENKNLPKDITVNVIPVDWKWLLISIGNMAFWAFISSLFLSNKSLPKLIRGGRG